jgi:uncharacterized protein
LAGKVARLSPDLRSRVSGKALLLDTMVIMHFAAKAALYLLLLVGLAAIPLGLGGTFIILVAALAVAVASKFQTVPVTALLVMAGMVAAGEILELILGSLLARRSGSSKWGMAGAFVGGIVGVVPGTAVMPVLGSLIGSFVGAALGAILLEWWHRRRLDPALRAGWGAIIGRVASILIKMSIGLAMVVYLVIRIAR